MWSDLGNRGVLRIGLYGDEANISENSFEPYKVFCLFLNVIHYRPRDIRLSRFLLFCVRSDWLAGPLTLRPILTQMALSFNLAFAGVGPETGSTLCKHGERFVLAEYRGDQDYHRLIWQHFSTWQSKFVCIRCKATSCGDSNNYTDLRDNPDWAQTERDTVSFINEELPPVPCALAILEFS